MTIDDIYHNPMLIRTSLDAQAVFHDACREHLGDKGIDRVYESPELLLSNSDAAKLYMVYKANLPRPETLFDIAVKKRGNRS